MKMKGLIVGIILATLVLAAVSSAVNLGYGQLPATWDWTNVGGVNYMPPIRDEDSCASCVAYAVATAIEAQYRISLGQVIRINADALFSETGGNCVTGTPSPTPKDGAYKISLILNYVMTIGAPSMPIPTTTTTCRLTRAEYRCTKTTTYTTTRYLIRGWGFLPEDVDAIKGRLLIGPLVTYYDIVSWIHVVDLIGWDGNAWKTQDSYLRDPHPPLAYGAEIDVAWLEVPGQITITTTTTNTDTSTSTTVTTATSTTDTTTTITTTTTTTASTTTTTTTTPTPPIIPCRRNC